MPTATVKPAVPDPNLRSPQVRNTAVPAVKVAPWSIVSVGFGPPANPIKTRAAIHHVVHWNKLREMLRPFGWEEVEGSAVILGDGDGSVISFRTRGEPKLPEPVQAWLAQVEPKGFQEAAKIASGAARFLGIIAKAFGVPQLGVIAAGATVVLDAIKDVFDGEEK